ncbi:MAG: heat-stable protein [Gaiellaceae bacterium]
MATSRSAGRCAGHTAPRHLRTLLALGAIGGKLDSLEAVLDGLAGLGADAAAIVGDLGAPWSDWATYRGIFKALGSTGKPTFWVPGPTDAPVRKYLLESYNMEVAYPHLHGVHGSLALGPGSVLFAGIGGEIVDDPSTIRMEEALLRYPGWEAEYRLRMVGEFDGYAKVFLFTTPPAHKGLGTPGSQVLAQLIKTYNPRVAVVAGERPNESRLGKTFVVCPGRLDRGDYALIDLGAL